MNKIRKKCYLKIEFKLLSPLNVGSGASLSTDKDIIKDPDGIPYIPASTVAGVVRDKFKEKYGDEMCAQEINKYFGNVKKRKAGVIEKNDDDRESIESRLLFYDAIINTENEGVNHISIRDSVALDEHKTAKKGAKFDMEVLGPGVRFITYVEQNIYSDADKDYLQLVADIFSSGLMFGAKTTRGYGKTGEVKTYFKSFAFTEGSDNTLDDWLDFNLYSYDGWGDPSTQSEYGSAVGWTIIVALELKGGISICRYTTQPHEKEEIIPDMEHLTSYDGEQQIVPVIPGTSWAGAFRHRMGEFGVDIDSENSIFGFAGPRSNERTRIRKKSKLVFSESVIHNAVEKVLSRNAIDRFSGGTANGAFYTEKTCYGGNTDLVISWRGKEKISENDRKALAAVLTDLHYGFLAVGGETSIGRGLFLITEINGKPIGVDAYEDISKILSEVAK